MISLRIVIAMPVLLCGITGCSPYDPPVLGDHASDRYKADLEACRTTSSHAVYLRNADNPGSWIISPITGPPALRAAIRTCMASKGYKLENEEG